MIIDSVKKPIIAPSANLSNKPPASNAEMVIDNFGDKVDLLVDGGESVEKIPSTIIDVRTFPYKIVRQGIIAADKFQSIYGIEIKN
jgi:L-threonylcarbamoyladenylate synthase